jgi:hypothetical protein
VSVDAGSLITWHDIRKGTEQNVPPVGAIQLGSIKNLPGGAGIKIYYVTVPAPDPKSSNGHANWNDPGRARDS